MRHAEIFAALDESANAANSIHKVKAVGLAGPWAGCACRRACNPLGARMGFGAHGGWHRRESAGNRPILFARSKLSLRCREVV